MYFDMLGLCLRFYMPVYGLEIHTISSPESEFIKLKITKGEK